MLIGRDRDELASTIERLRPKRMGAERYARDTNAGTVADHYERAMRLIEAGVTTLIVRLVDVGERRRGRATGHADRAVAISAIVAEQPPLLTLEADQQQGA